MPEAEQITQGAAPPPSEQSFGDRKRAQLHAERRGGEPPESRNQPDRTLDETPRERLESAGSEAPDDEDRDFLDTEEFGEGDESDDLDNETLIDEEALEPDETDVNWRKRFEETESKLKQVTANRREMEGEHAEMMTTHVNLKHELQDKLTEAKQWSNAYVGGFTQQINQLEYAFQNGLVPPDQMPQARQQHQMFIQQRNQIQGQIDQMNQHESAVKRQERERLAEIARVRLSRSIPGWSREVHHQLGEFAESRGFTREEFSSNLDYRFLELLHDSMQLHQAGNAVKSVTRKRKANGPRRNAPVESRSADGRYKLTKKAFLQNPGEKGRFTDMKTQQLAKERRGR